MSVSLNVSLAFWWSVCVFAMSFIDVICCCFFCNSSSICHNVCLSVCLSVCLFVCLSLCPSVCLSVCSNTFYSLFSCLIWPAKIFMEGSHQGQCFKTFLNNIGLLMKKFSYAVYFLKILFVQALCLDAVTIIPHFV